MAEQRNGVRRQAGASCCWLLRRGWLFLVLAIASLNWPIAARAEPPALVDFWRQAFARPDAKELKRRLPPPQQSHLGAKLFRDSRLSGDGARACASCHRPDQAFTDGLQRARSAGSHDAVLRNTPSLYNLAWAKAFNWDGSAASLEAQTAGPIQHPAELGADFSRLRQRLEADPEMVAQFRLAFPPGGQVTRQTITKALAAYVRSLVSPQSRFDRWVEGEGAALTETELAGFKVFVGKGGCVGCHSGWRLTDDGFYDIGLAGSTKIFVEVDAGKKGLWAFKTPSLRNVGATAPYMHDGSLATLEDVIEHYADGVAARKGVAGNLPRSLSLTDQDRADLIAFLETL